MASFSRSCTFMRKVGSTLATKAELADPRIEHDLRAELFDHLDLRVEAEIGGIGRPCQVDVLGPDAQGGVGAAAAVGAAGDLLRECLS
jgi:hypothetical protein